MIRAAGPRAGCLLERAGNMFERTDGLTVRATDRLILKGFSRGTIRAAAPPSGGAPRLSQRPQAHPDRVRHGARSEVSGSKDSRSLFLVGGPTTVNRFCQHSTYRLE
jgi:hypothetical protein